MINKVMDLYWLDNGAGFIHMMEKLGKGYTMQYMKDQNGTKVFVSRADWLLNGTTTDFYITNRYDVYLTHRDTEPVRFVPMFNRPTEEVDVFLTDGVEISSEFARIKEVPGAIDETQLNALIAKFGKVYLNAFGAPGWVQTTYKKYIEDNYPTTVTLITKESYPENNEVKCQDLVLLNLPELSMVDVWHNVLFTTDSRQYNVYWFDTDTDIHEFNTFVLSIVDPTATLVHEDGMYKYVSEKTDIKVLVSLRLLEVCYDLLDTLSTDAYVSCTNKTDMVTTTNTLIGGVE